MGFLTRGLLGPCLGVVLFSRPAAAPVSTELVHFASGQVMAVAGHHVVDGRTVSLSLRNGGAVLFDASIIDRFEPVVRVASPASAPRAAPRPLPAKPYADVIRRASVRHGVPDVLLHALIEVESGYDPAAESLRGAMGLMQLMPVTAVQYDVRDPFDPAANVDAGTRHLRALLDKFGMRAGLAAYNAGEEPVLRYGGVPPYPETRTYIDRILRIVDAAGQD